MKRIRLFTLPNLITVGNLICGSMAAVTALTGGDLRIAFWWIVAAAVCDFLDGFTARLLNSYSGIGVELDSLADVISFGFAPAAILYRLYGESLWHWALPEAVTPIAGALIFLLAGAAALRLAKFNVDEEQQSEFKGLPTPASALFCASLGWLFANGNLQLGREVTLAVVLLMAVLMLCNMRMFSFKFKGFGWRGNSLRYSFAGVAVLLAVWLKVGSIPLIILLYILTSGVSNLLCSGDSEAKKSSN